jgi:hypothetical protein
MELEPYPLVLEAVDLNGLANFTILLFFLLNSSIFSGKFL